MHSGIVLIVAGMAAYAVSAPAQTYPQRTVRVIVPFAAGGNTDITARAIGAKLTDVFAQQVIVDNRPGGATNIGRARREGPA
jgi:tripartite-type tricarboxylate transporter receptor subunit TctC